MSSVKLGVWQGEGLTTWGVTSVWVSVFFQDQLFSVTVFEHKLLFGSPLFWDWFYRTGVHNRCSEMGWPSVFCAGEWLHHASFTLYVLLLLLLLLFIFSFAVLLNCFYPKPWVLTFVSWFSSTSHQGESGAWVRSHMVLVAAGANPWQALTLCYELLLLCAFHKGKPP